jgi:hypothetical protein
MPYLLDTNIISDLIRNPKGRVTDRMHKVGRSEDRHQHYCRCRASFWCRTQRLSSSDGPCRRDPRFDRGIPLRITCRSRVRHPPQPPRSKGQSCWVKRSSYRRARPLSWCNPGDGQRTGIRNGKNPELRKLASLMRLNPVLQLGDWATSFPVSKEVPFWFEPE